MDVPVIPFGGPLTDVDVVVALAAGRPLRDRMASLLMRDGLTVAGEGAGPEELAAACRTRPPHVAVLAWDACGARPAAGLRTLLQRLPRTRAVVVLAHPRREDLRRALDAGADGAVLSIRLAATLGPAVRAVCAGQACVPRELRRQFQRPALSPREKQVLAMVATGLTNGEVAARLYLSESTVKGHLAGAFAKLDVHSREEATALVLDPEARVGIALLAFPAPPGPATNGATR
jgi:DNA-binding NarL/FixJ family response regulator